MKGIVRHVVAGAAAGALALVASPVHAQDQNQDTEVGDTGYDYYDSYDAGYGADYDDDWFYDYYEVEDDELGAEEGYGDYDWYADYDYDADVFDWEEDGLFD